MVITSVCISNNDFYKYDILKISKNIRSANTSYYKVVMQALNPLFSVRARAKINFKKNFLVDFRAKSCNFFRASVQFLL